MTAVEGNDRELLDHATRSIAVGSKSFAAAAQLFDPATRRSAVMLYAWCRHCDDVIDGQEAGHDARPVSQEEVNQRLAGLEAQTRAVYARMPPQTEAFAAFRDVVIRHGLKQAYALEHLAGFEMDVQQRQYVHIEDTLDYCYHVAGVVGLMMAQVMGVSDERTLDRACDLGLAFQLQDDLLDYGGDTKAMGKNVGDDLAEGKPTLPLIQAMAVGTDDEAKLIRSAIRKGGLEHLDDVLAIINRTGSLEYTREKAYKMADKAKTALDCLPDSIYKERLALFADLAVKRSA